MKRVLSLGAILLALGSCQSDNAPTQPSTSTEMVGVSARLVSTSALPTATRFRARLTIGSQPGTWIDTTYDKGTAIRLGKVRRGSVVTLDVQGYSVQGKDSIWKWFANKSESVTGNLAWKVMETEVIGLALVPPASGQPLKLPGGSWYTTDTIQSWTSAPAKSTVDSTGLLPPLSGRVLRIRLRVGIPGTKDTLVGDTLRIAIPQKPSILPALRKLEATDVVRIVAGATGDTLEYCKGQSCADWAEYSTPLASEAFTLRARARRSGLVSLVEEAMFALESSLPPDTASTVDTIVPKPNISPASGALANTDRITITASKTQDTLWIKVGEGDWARYVDPIPAGAFEILAVSRRGKYHSDTARAVFTLSTTKPASPEFLNDCQIECDPGTRIGFEPSEPGDTIQYALLSDSTVWHPYTAAKIMLEESNTVLARVVRGPDTSATQRSAVTIVQPAAVTFTSARRTADTVWVVASSTSGAVWFRRDQATDSALAIVTEPIAVRVGHSISAWASRGTKKSTVRTFTAEAVQPSRPSIAPTDSIIGLQDSIKLSPATSGDTIQYRIGAASDWMDYKNPIAPGIGGLFTITVSARRNGAFSTDAVRTFFVDTAQLASPTISQDLSKSLDPGTEFVVSVAKDFTLEYTTDTTKVWSSITTSLRFTADKDTTIFARTKSATKASPIKVFAITIQQPGSINFAVSTRRGDAITVGIVANPGDTILYSRNSETSTNSAVGLDDTVFVSVPMNESITARAKRGTKLGEQATYTARPSAPMPPRIAPEGGDIRDTTRISISGNIGDTLAYRVGSTLTWTPYTSPFTLQPGVTVVYASSTRYGLSSHDTATFTVHGRPDMVRFGGCSIECDPGTPLILTASPGSAIRWSTDTALVWNSYDATSPPAVTESAIYWAHADSAGHRSATSSRPISVLQPRSPIITAVKVTRDTAAQLAQIDVQADQAGDSLFVTIDDAEVFKGRVATAPLKRTFELRSIDSEQELRAFTKRGIATSLEAEMPVYTLEEFSMPVPEVPSGAYTIGKTFRFTLPGNSQVGEAILLSTDLGVNWSRIDSIKLNETAMVWARSVRRGFGDSYDSSAIRKMSYSMDSVILSHVVIQSGAARHSFELQRSGPKIMDTLPYGSDPVRLSVGPRNWADLQSVTYSCLGCTRVDSNTFRMSDYGREAFTVVATSKTGLSLTIQMNVTKTSPWNRNYPTSSVTDTRNGRTYKTTTIGGATWMAENLDLERHDGPRLGQCFKNDSAICREFGREYAWYEAMNLDSECDAFDCGSQISTTHRGICPEGFHVPTMNEWKNLLQTVDPAFDPSAFSSRVAPQKLRSNTAAWLAGAWPTAATDDYSFRALPSNFATVSGSNPLQIQGLAASWWSAEQSVTQSEANAQVVHLGSGEVVSRKDAMKSQPQPLRCVRD